MLERPDLHGSVQRGEFGVLQRGKVFSGRIDVVGEFKVPALRNVAQTAPYMHNGSLATLADVVRHYSEISPDRLHSDGESLLKPLRLAAGESADLVGFLESLSESASALPRRRPVTPCR